jgi:hypothetical protein
MPSGASLPRAMSVSAMARFGASSLRRRLRLKKIVRAAAQDRPDIAAERMRWQEDHKQLNPKRFVFIDETWASLDRLRTNMASTHGQCRRGQRLYAKVPDGRWKGYQSTTAAFTGWLLKSEAIPRGSDD